MVLGILSTSFAALSLLCLFYAPALLGIVLAVAGFVCGLVGRHLYVVAVYDGVDTGKLAAGRWLGLIGWILSLVTLVIYVVLFVYGMMQLKAARDAINDYYQSGSGWVPDGYSGSGIGDALADELDKLGRD